MSTPGPRLIDPADVAARARAALAFADIKVKDSQQRIGIAPSTMARIVSPTSPRGASLEERASIAIACGVPTRFLEHGFDDEILVTATIAAAEFEVLADAVRVMLQDEPRPDEVAVARQAVDELLGTTSRLPEADAPRAPAVVPPDAPRQPGASGTDRPHRDRRSA